MSKKSHHQRRRRRSNRVWLWKLIVVIGQATFYVVRFWFWFSDPK